ncbi:NUDIX hydrolase [Streptomyces sp. ST2-7A]|uniref:NUDIX hydrolase n=1 Tax=Streptomyces sp. ST2-7A TaxID=2907214 RepID=UPI001F2D8268|nr:NUDIX hydrolase [Streptomyces sp. ST2-7A]MCE7079871.1 NUDIX hydrolase [Streptomyces sp. ST2-7A]
MRWTIHGERPLHRHPWLELTLLEVERPDGSRCEQHAIRLRDVAACVVVDAEQRVLLMWRHRLVADSWGWELPMGVVDEGETPERTAVREAEEETGWRPGTPSPLIRAEPAGGIMDARHHVFRADSVGYVGPPAERNESDRIEWVPRAEVLGMIDRGEIRSGITVVGLLRWLIGEPTRRG